MPTADWVSYAALGVSGLAVAFSGATFATARSSLKTARAAHGTAQRALEVGGHNVVLEAEVFSHGDGLVCDFTATNKARGAVDIVRLACVFHDHEPGGIPVNFLRPPRWGPELPARLEGASQAVWSGDLIAAFADAQRFQVDGRPYLNGPFYFAVKLGDGSYVVDQRERQYIDRLLYDFDITRTLGPQHPPGEQRPPV
jgi:hypothetical protein